MDELKNLPTNIGELIKNLPEKERSELTHLLIAQSNTTVHYQGFLPPLEIIEGYKEVDNFKERMVIIAEKEQSHRHSIEIKNNDALLKAIKSDSADTKIGLSLGFFSFVVLLSSIALASYLDKENIALALCVALGVGVVGSFTNKNK